MLKSEKRTILKNKINQLNKEIKKIYKHIEENEDIFGYMDLKLYDASYYIYSDMEKDYPDLKNDKINIFNDFTELNFNMFIEDLKINYCIDFNNMIDSIGRSSSFYLYKDIGYIDKNMGVIEELSYKYYGIPLLFDYDYIYNDYFLEYNENMINDYYDLIIDLNDLIEDIYIYFKKDIKDIKTVYNYIKDFKNNQIEYFKEFIKDYYGDKND